jgi:hypothetical protein
MLQKVLTKDIQTRKVWFPYAVRVSAQTFRVALRQEQAAEVAAENAKRSKRGGDLLRKTPALST